MLYIIMSTFIIQGLGLIKYAIFQGTLKLSSNGINFGQFSEKLL
jgi:hypothetical protein